MKKKLLISLGIVGLALSGCAEKNVDVNKYKQELTKKENIIKKQKIEIQKKEEEINKLKTSSQNKVQTNPNSDLPPNAKPGECYARVLIPAEYKTYNEKIKIQPEFEVLKTTLPEFSKYKAKILVKPESYKYVVKPAVYKCVEKTYIKRPASFKYKVIPAKFKTVYEKVMVEKPVAYWKKGNGPISKIDNLTGEIMCLVKKPAVYVTIAKKELVEPAHVEKVKIPAVYETVKVKELVKPAHIEKIKIPAEYKIVTVEDISKPAEVIRTKHDAQYTVVTKKELVKPERVKWERIVCKTNLTPERVKKIQKILKEKGYYSGPINGEYNYATKKAIEQFQKDNHLAIGALTYETVNALNK